MWIESHQSLGGHPKTKKLCRLLKLSKVEAVGHLHFLWWWALDYAQDGDLSRFELVDICVGSEWEGDEAVFVDALVSAEFLDRDGERLVIHDWHEYAGKLIERRARNAERMRNARAGTDDARADDDETRALHVQRTNDARVQLPNQPNQTVPNQPDQTNTPPTPQGGKRVRVLPKPDDAGFDEWYAVYPRHIAPSEARKAWTKLSIEERAAAMTAIQRQLPFFRTCPPDKVPHPTTWLNQRRWEDEITATGPARASPSTGPTPWPADIPPRGSAAFRSYEDAERYRLGMSTLPDWDGTDGRGNRVRRDEPTERGPAEQPAGGERATPASRPGGRASPAGLPAD